MKRILLFSVFSICLSGQLFSQNVGINTSLPDRPLTIKGIGQNNELVSFKNVNDTTRWHINMENGALNFVQSGVVNARLNLAPNGNTGIGTATPLYKLDVHRNSREGVIANFNTNTSRGEIQISNYLTSGVMGVIPEGLYLRPQDGTDVFFQTDSINRMIIKSGTGHTGIGTATPLYKLDVHNNFQQGPVANFNTNSSRGEIQITNYLTSGVIGVIPEGLYLRPQDGTDVFFQTDSINRMIIKSGTGNVGIQTQSAGTSLTVNGGFSVTSQNIQINGGLATVNPGNRSYIRLNNTSNIACQVTLTDGLSDGQILVIVAQSSGGGAVQFLDSAVTKTQLNSNFAMGIDDSLTLIWDAGLSKWIELNRSVN